MKSLAARHVAFLAACAAGVAALLLSLALVPRLSWAIAANAGFLAYLAFGLRTLTRMNAGWLKRHAASDDVPVWIIFLVTLLAVGVSVVDRYRTTYKRDDETISGSDANYLDVSVMGMLPLAWRTALTLGVDARHQTGLDSDDTIAAAAYAGGGVSVGLTRQFAGDVVLQPMLRAQFGSLKSAEKSASVTGFGVGVTLSRRF